MKPAVYITAGETFNRLTALEDAARSKQKIAWRCVCGTERRILAALVRRGESRSCGCLAREVAAAKMRAVNSKRGNKWKHPLYGTWVGIMRRTSNPRAADYHRYGGRGIAVCDRWREAETFFADIERTLGQRPEGMTLDRIDNDGNYEPGNLRWATASMQMRNRRRPRRKPGRHNYREVVAFIATWRPTA